MKWRMLKRWVKSITHEFCIFKCSKMSLCYSCHVPFRQDRNLRISKIQNFCNKKNSHNCIRFFTFDQKRSNWKNTKIFKNSNIINHNGSNEIRNFAPNFCNRLIWKIFFKIISVIWLFISEFLKNCQVKILQTQKIKKMIKSNLRQVTFLKRHELENIKMTKILVLYIKIFSQFSNTDYSRFDWIMAD